MRIRMQPCVLLMLAVVTVTGAAAQDPPKSEQQSEHLAPTMNMVEMSPASMFLMNLASGTSANPASWPMPMIMTHYRNWNTMFMGLGFLSDIQQSGPRGGVYALFDGTNIFKLSDQNAPAKFAAQKVVVTGTLNEKQRRSK